MGKLRKRLISRRGVMLSRASVYACIVTAVIATVILIPGIRAYQERRARFLCEVSLERTRENVIMDYLEHPADALDGDLNAAAGPGGLCPSGGDVYLIPGMKTEEIKLVCALHGEDKAQCLHLNAMSALPQLRRNIVLYGPEWNGLSVTLNSTNIPARHLMSIPEKLSAGGDALDLMFVTSEYTRREDSLIWMALQSGRRAVVWSAENGWQEEYIW